MNDDWAWQSLLQDFRERKQEKLTDALPPEFTVSWLQVVRYSACRMVEPRLCCAKWRPRTPPSGILHSSVVDEVEDDSPEMVTSDYVCVACTHPVVSTMRLMEKVFAKSAEDVHDEKTWRRYVNDAAPMKPELFQRVVANAWGLGWLGFTQILTVWMQITELQASKLAWRRVTARAKERKAYAETGMMEISEDELNTEFQIQMESLVKTGYEQFEKRQKSLGRLDLPVDILSWIQETDA